MNITSLDLFEVTLNEKYIENSIDQKNIGLIQPSGRSTERDSIDWKAWGKT